MPTSNLPATVLPSLGDDLIYPLEPHNGEHYIRTAGFRPESRTRIEDVALYVTHKIDCDLVDYCMALGLLGCDMSRSHKEWAPLMYVAAAAMEPAQLAAIRAQHRAAVHAALARVLPGSPPTVEVDSGNGLHFYWWLRVPVSGAAEISAAAETNRQIMLALNRSVGYQLADPKACAANQLLRPVPSYNTKLPTCPRPVYIIGGSADARWEANAFIVRDLVPEPEEMPEPTCLSDRVQALLLTSRQIRDLFQGVGKPLTAADGSPLDVSSSGYGYSLASALARKGCDDAEIVAADFLRVGSPRDLRRSYLVAEKVLDDTRPGAAARRNINAAVASSGREHVDLGQPFHELGGTMARLLSLRPGVYDHEGPVRLADRDGILSIVPLTDSAVRVETAAVATFVATGPTGPRVVHPTIDAVNALRGLSSLSPMSELRSVAHCPYPVRDKAGRVRFVSEAGYDPDTKIYLACSGVEAPPEAPTREQIAAALAELDEVLCDFPFADESAKAACLASMLSPIVVPDMTECAPINTYDSSVGGSGKDYLAQTVSIIATGEPTTIAVFPSSEEELDKRILSYGRAGRTLVTLSNKDGRVSSSCFEAATASRNYSARLLGVSEAPSVRLDCVWSLTGINVQLAGSLPRRALWVRLRPTMEHPELRSDFRRPDLHAYVRERRPQLLSALLVVLAAGVAYDGPELPGWVGYGQWSRYVRRAVVACGLPDPFDGRAEMQTDGGTQTDGELLEALQQLYPLTFTAKEAARSKLIPDLRTACGLRDNDSVTPQRVGTYLRGLRDRIIGGRSIAISGVDKSTHVVSWQVVSV